MDARTDNINLDHEVAIQADKNYANEEGGTTHLSNRKLGAITLKSEEKIVILEDQKCIDALTNLPNEPGINRDLLRIIHELKRQPEDERDELLILAIDNRYFKIFNDLFGQDSGNTHLKNVGLKLRGNGEPGKVRPYDIVGRLYGDDFVVVVRLQKSPAQTENVRNILIRLTVLGDELSKEEMDMNILKFEEEVKKDRKRVLSALRLPNDDERDLKWQNYNIGSFSIGGALISLSNTELNNVIEGPQDGLWTKLFLPQVEPQLDKAKKMTYVGSRAVVVTPEGEIRVP